MSPRPEAGLRAWFDGDCPLCAEPIVRNVSRIVAKHGDWRHVACHLREHE